MASHDRVPKAQLLLDDVFLMLVAGLVVPTLFYIVWGFISLANIPTFNR